MQNPYTTQQLSTQMPSPPEQPKTRRTMSSIPTWVIILALCIGISAIVLLSAAIIRGPGTTTTQPNIQQPMVTQSTSTSDIVEPLTVTWLVFTNTDETISFEYPSTARIDSTDTTVTLTFATGGSISLQPAMSLTYTGTQTSFNINGQAYDVFQQIGTSAPQYTTQLNNELGLQIINSGGAREFQDMLRVLATTQLRVDEVITTEWVTHTTNWPYQNIQFALPDQWRVTQDDSNRLVIYNTEDQAVAVIYSYERNQSFAYEQTLERAASVQAAVVVPSERVEQLSLSVLDTIAAADVVLSSWKIIGEQSTLTQRRLDIEPTNQMPIERSVGQYFRAIGVYSTAAMIDAQWLEVFAGRVQILDQATAWTEYESQDLGVSLLYPPAWGINTLQTNETAVVFDTGDPMLSFSMKSTTTPASLLAVVDQFDQTSITGYGQVLLGKMLAYQVDFDTQERLVVIPLSGTDAIALSFTTTPLSQQVAQTVTVHTVAEIPISTATYTNSAFGFSIQYPDQYIAEDGVGDVVAMVVPSGITDPVMAPLVIRDFDEGIVARISTLSSQLEFTQVVSQTPVTIAGNSGVKVVFDVATGQQVMVYLLATPEGNIEIEFPAAVPAYEDIAKSFELVD